VELIPQKSIDLVETKNSISLVQQHGIQNNFNYRDLEISYGCHILGEIFKIVPSMN